MKRLKVVVLSGPDGGGAGGGAEGEEEEGGWTLVDPEVLEEDVVSVDRPGARRSIGSLDWDWVSLRDIVVSCQAIVYPNLDTRVLPQHRHRDSIPSFSGNVIGGLKVLFYLFYLFVSSCMPPSSRLFRCDSGYTSFTTRTGQTRHLSFFQPGIASLCLAYTSKFIFSAP